MRTVVNGRTRDVCGRWGADPARVQNQTPEDRAAIQEALDIIERMLTVTPRRRPTAKDVFANAFFSESAPHPTPRDQLEGLGGRDGHSYAAEHQRNRVPLALPLRVFRVLWASETCGRRIAANTMIWPPRE